MSRLSLLGVCSILSSCFLGSVLIVSSAFHLFNPVVFFEDLMAYDMVDQSTAIWMTLLLPTVMFVSGLAVLNRLANKRVLFATSILVLVFLIAQSSAWASGLKINCGCFGLSSHEVGWVSIAFTASCLLCNGLLVWEKIHETCNVQRFHAS